MIPTAIGLPSPWTNRKAYWQAMDWMIEHDLEPYLPQLIRTGITENLGTIWNDQKEEVEWGSFVINYVKRYKEPMIFAYSPYWYAKHPRVLWWKIDDEAVNQDELSLGEMTHILAKQKRWFIEQGIPNAWVLIDEPPINTTGSYWTKKIEKRIVKFVTALAVAGWTVRVAVPNHWSYNYWSLRLPTKTKWILHTHTRINKLDGGLPESLWIYNMQYTYEGFARILNKFLAVGYLVYSAISPVGDNPVLWESGPTDEMFILIDELKTYTDSLNEDGKPDNELSLEEIKQLKALLAAMKNVFKE